MMFKKFIHDLNGKLACMAYIDTAVEVENDPDKKKRLKLIKCAADEMADQIRDYYTSQECALILDFEDRIYKTPEM